MLRELIKEGGEAPWKFISLICLLPQMKYKGG
jgi:hypothetical protein